jgi:protocatechuate 3,4-dioxygenase beta subunit
MYDDPSREDHRHDRGLAFDLAILRASANEPARFERRKALQLLAGAGLVLVACGSDGSTASTTTTTTTGGSTTTAGGGATTTTGASATSVDAIPEETGGPYPADGSNGPNVLDERGVVREDIRSSFGAYSGTAEGVPLTIDLTVVAATTGAPLPGAAVYLWHCDRDGRYSLYSSGVTDQNYLRGVQETGDDGRLRFSSTFPAAYSGRWPHIHFEVFSDLATATSDGAPVVTSQLALPPEVCTAVYATAGYEQSLSNLARTSLDGDMVFSDGYDDQLAAVSGTVDGGMTAALTVGV